MSCCALLASKLSVVCTPPACLQLEEDLGDDYRWSYRVSKVLYSGKSDYQEVDLVDTPTWGKVIALCNNKPPKP